jgi:hypothetical protein
LSIHTRVIGTDSRRLEAKPDGVGAQPVTRARGIASAS